MSLAAVRYLLDRAEGGEGGDGAEVNNAVAALTGAEEASAE